MFEILSGDKTIIDILGKQEIKENKNYRIINFCIIHDMKYGHLILNTLTRKLIFLSNDEYQNFVLENKFSEVFDYMIENYFLIPDENNDFGFYKNLFNIYKLLHNSDPCYTIFPTLSCNARCFYCFENGIEKKSMSFSVADQTVKYICENSKNQKVRIQWFGGEPLCNTKAIDIISSQLNDYGTYKNYLKSINF